MSLLWSIDLVLLLQSLAFTVKSQSECLQTNNTNGLPPFMGYPALPEDRIHHQHQAIIPTYKFTCCGNITEWGVDLSPVERGATFNFDFQVWRPSPTVNDDGSGCYSLVGNYAVRSISIDTTVTSDHVARVTPSIQLQFQPGDVLGFYAESDGTTSDDNNGVVLLVSASYTSELVWHASITDRSSMSGSCPYPVGTIGILSFSTRAAPVISISTSAYSCPQSSYKVVLVTSTSTLNPRNTYSVLTTPTTFLTATPGITETDLVVSNVPLIAGSLVTFVVVCGVLTVMTVLVAITVIRKRRANKAALPTQVKTGMVDATEKDIKLEANPLYDLAKIKHSEVETDPYYEQVRSGKDIEVADNPSYEQIATTMEVNPSYDSAQLRNT